jgi:hypothetical protein
MTRLKEIVLNADFKNKAAAPINSTRIFRRATSPI